MSTGRMFCRAAMPERTMRRCLFSFFQKVRRTSVNGVIPYLREMNFVSVMFRLILAMVCGGMIGLERGRKRRPAGFRTYMLVCLGAALTMLLSQYEFAMVMGPWQGIAQELGMKTDVSRFGAQVINGIGFLGAGAILREGFTVRGLTTAASVWVVACLGLSVGMGYYVLTAVGTVIAFVTLTVFDGIQEKIRTKSRPEMDMQIECEHMGDLMVELSHLAERHFAKLLNLSFGRTPHNTYVISFRANFPPKGYEAAQNQFRQELASVPGLIRMENHKE